MSKKITYNQTIIHTNKLVVHYLSQRRGSQRKEGERTITSDGTVNNI